MKLLSQNQLRPHRFVSLVIACLQACQKLPGFHLCLIKAWSHSFARILENEIHPGSVRQISMIIHFPITVVIQSDIEPIVRRLLGVGSFLVDRRFYSSRSSATCGIIQEEEETEAMGDSSDSEAFEITDLVHQFMAVTGAEDTMALSYLQQSSWNVEVCSAVFLLTFQLP